MSRRIKWHPTPAPKIIHFPRRRRFSFNRRERVEEEDKWRVQAEMLRAECNLLRMEREFALKKLDKNTLKMETTLRSAVQTLLSGRDNIFEGKNAKAVLEDLEEKLEELRKSSRIRDSQDVMSSNFDKKASILQRRLQKHGELSIHNVEKKKMEGVSKDDNKSGNSSVASSASASASASTSKRIEFCTRHQGEVGDENRCSGHCKAVVRKIVEQVRAETEQWSQMQEMVLLVRAEMEHLHTSRDFWQNRANHSDYQIQSLTHAVEEWKEKALDYENKANKHELQVSLLKEEMQKCKVQVVKEDTNHFGAPLSLGKQLANEKRMLFCRLKENLPEEEEDGRRKPFTEIGNSSSLLRQNPIRTPVTRSFRKY